MEDKTLQYNVIFRAEPEGGFTALVPSLPGCISYGKDLAEAKKMIADALGLYVSSLQEDREDVPNDEESVIGLVSSSRNVKVRHA